MPRGIKGSGEPRKFADIFKKYKHYKPAETGYGNVSDWRSAFETRLNTDEAHRVIAAADGSPLSILGLTEIPLTKEDIKRAYRKMVMIHHPDMGGTEEKFKEINAAYTVLMEKL